MRVCVDTSALPAILRDFHDKIMPTIAVTWLDAADHARAVAAVLSANRRSLSVVDCASFEAARRLHAEAVFALDRHFVEQGFVCLPVAGD